MTWLWLALAVLAGWGLAYCVDLALRPKPKTDPDWFWQGGEWVPSEYPGLAHGTYSEFRTEQSDRPESKPTSGAG